MLVPSNYFLKQLLTKAKAAIGGGAIDGILSPLLLTVHLFQNDLNVTPEVAVADFDVADFSGYADITPVVWGTVYKDTVGDWVQESALMQFLQTADTITNTVFGYYVTTTAGGGNWLIAERFGDGIPMAGPDRAINMALRIQLPQNIQLGSANRID